MKRWLVLLFVTVLTRPCMAAITDPEVIQEKSFAIHFSTVVPINANPASFVMVSLSTPTIFPHQERGEIDISHVEVEVDKLAASSGTVKLGVITFINQSTGTVKFFYEKSFGKNVSNTEVRPYTNYSPAFIRARANPGAQAGREPFTDGLTPYFISNDTRSGSALYRSTATTITQLNTPTGIAVSPNMGDIIMEVINSDATNTINVKVNLFYHSEK